MTRRHRHRMSPLRRDQAGAALVEFAIIAPVLISLVGAATDLGRAVVLTLRLQDAARTGAQYITLQPGDTTGATTAATSTLTGVTGASVAVGAMACQCPAAGAATGGGVVTCTSTCATGIIQYVTVTATAPFTPIFPASQVLLLSFDTLTSTSGSVTVRLH